MGFSQIGSLKKGEEGKNKSGNKNTKSKDEDRGKPGVDLLYAAGGEVYQSR